MIPLMGAPLTINIFLSQIPYFEDPRQASMLCKAGGHCVHVFFDCLGDKSIYYNMCIDTTLTQHSSSGSLFLILRELDRYQNSN